MIRKLMSDETLQSLLESESWKEEAEKIWKEIQNLNLFSAIQTFLFAPASHTFSFVRFLIPGNSLFLISRTFLRFKDFLSYFYEIKKRVFVCVFPLFNCYKLKPIAGTIFYQLRVQSKLDLSRFINVTMMKSSMVMLGFMLKTKKILHVNKF